MPLYCCTVHGNSGTSGVISCLCADEVQNMIAENSEKEGTKGLVEQAFPREYFSQPAHAHCIPMSNARMVIPKCECATHRILGDL